MFIYFIILASEFYQKASIFYFIPWGASQIVFALIYQYITTNWRQLILFTMAIPSLIMIILIVILKESPRYLFFTEGKLVEAITTLNEIAIINKRQPFESEEINKLKDVFPNEIEKKYNYFDLFRYNSLKRITIPTAVINTTFDLAYYCIQFSFSSLGLSLFQNAVYVGFGEILVYLAASKILL